MFAGSLSNRPSLPTAGCSGSQLAGMLIPYLVHPLYLHRWLHWHSLAAFRSRVLEVEHREGAVGLGKAPEEGRGEAEGCAQQRLVHCDMYGWEEGRQAYKAVK